MASPDNPVEFPGVAPPENEVDENVVPPLFPSDYDSNNKSDDSYEDADTSTQQTDYMPPMVKNVYNIRPQKQTD